MSQGDPYEEPQDSAVGNQPAVGSQPALDGQPVIGTQPPLQRIRVRSAKREALRYVSHLDMHMVWERTLRRAGLPLAYSKGFHPNPRLHLASALPLGFLSRCEITDFWLDLAEPPDLAVLAAQVQAAAPPGLEILQVETVPLREPALQIQVTAAEFAAAPLDPVDEAALSQAVSSLLASQAILRERRGKPYDLRPLVESLEVIPGEQPLLRMRLAAREGATGRPEEVLQALGQDPAGYRVERLKLFLL